MHAMTINKMNDVIDLADRTHTDCDMVVHVDKQPTIDVSCLSHWHLNNPTVFQASNNSSWPQCMHLKNLIIMSDSSRADLMK
jgi:hypothetical protein